MIRWVVFLAVGTAACAASPPEIRRAPEVDASVVIADAALDAAAVDGGAPDAAPDAPHATLPLMVPGEFDCRATRCKSGEEVCCGSECKPVVEVRAGEIATSIAATCAPGKRGNFPLYGPILGCETSAQCAPNAICCGASLASDREGLSSMQFFSVQICTDNPGRDCNSIELCDGASCRAPRSTRTIPCGGKSCSGAKPSCSYDERSPIEITPDAPKHAPECVSVHDVRGLRDMVVRCRSHRDCPGPLPGTKGIGAQCILYDFVSGDTHCLYNHTPTTMAFATPACESDSDCRELWPRWAPLAGADPAHPPPIKCVPLGDSARRWQCLMPWRMPQNRR